MDNDMSEREKLTPCFDPECELTGPHRYCLRRSTPTTERVDGRETDREAATALCTRSRMSLALEVVRLRRAALSPSPAADVRREALEEAAKAAEGYALRQEEEGEGDGREWATAHAIANSIRTLAAPPVDQEQEK